MNLIDRYLNAIRWQLPEAGRDDVVEELRDTLLSSVEDKEATLGRTLTDTELEELLHAFGHPMRVAARYRTRQHLIGPEILPLFEFGARAAGAVVLILGGVDLLLGLMGGETVGRAITGAMARVWHDGIYALGVLTFVALVMEFSGVKLWNGRWKLRDLPSTPAPPKMKRKSVFETLFELGFGVLAVLWWTGVVPFPTDWLQSRWGDVRIEPAPIWAELYWPILALLILGVLQNLLDLFARGLPRLRGVGTIVTAGAALWVATLLLQADHWAAVVGAPNGAIAASLNLSLRIAWIVCAAIAGVQVLRGLWMVVRGSRSGC